MQQEGITFDRFIQCCVAVKSLTEAFRKAEYVPQSRLEGNADAFEQPSESWECYHVVRAIHGDGSVSAMIGLKMLYDCLECCTSKDERMLLSFNDSPHGSLST